MRNHSTATRTDTLPALRQHPTRDRRGSEPPSRHGIEPRRPGGKQCGYCCATHTFDPLGRPGASSGSPLGAPCSAQLLTAHRGTDLRYARGHDAEEFAADEHAHIGPLLGAHSDSSSPQAPHSAHAQKSVRPLGP
jgi:hypothetical protein